MRVSPRDARTLVLVALAVVGVVAAVPAGLTGPADATNAPTRIDSCTTIKQSGEYVLTSDVKNGGKTPISKPCIRIAADDVTLDGKGHTLDGRGVSHTKGITVDGATGVTIRNLEVNDWHYGIYVRNGSAEIREVRTFSNAYGVKLENASGSTVANNVVEENLIGIYVDPGNGVNVENNEVRGNEVAVKYIDGANAASSGSGSAGSDSGGSGSSNESA
ncbi:MULTISPECIES: right-handed parallel beta-helix repeat-containing protein [Halorussus]|uniref:right-handed parallel beta-helix repeat-containing protein n=1 Tax=Halorussus TaxID=1070314 RepID=UPI0020A00FF4|nr:right-handed parallel beta-helix repeat-containing protein [Halorussus vallis]USZ78146.1 right-handed parallel beta-helix repeat-containing protein [Halorussus vallis]